MVDKIISWGILGTSFISRQMATAIKASSLGALTAIASRQNDRACEFAQDFAIPKTYSSYDRLIDDKDVDVIYIGLPNHLHAEWIIKCLRAGKHVLCEKTLVLNEAQMLAVIDAAGTSGTLCMEALMYRCHPLIKKLKQIIEEGVLGKIHLFQASYTAPIAHLANPIAGGAIYNLGCYPLSLVQFLAPSKVVGLIGTGIVHAQHHQNDTLSSVMLTFADQSMACITTGDDLEMSWRFEIHGSLGRLEMITNPWLPAPGEQTFKVYINGQHEPTAIKIESELNVYTYQINTVNQSILDLETALFERITLNESLRNIRLLELWRRQVLERPTYLNELGKTPEKYPLSMA